MASHSHSRHQFTLAIDGALQVEASAGTWTVPPGAAVWIPRNMEHAERFHAGAALCTLYVDASLPDTIGDRGRTVIVSPLLREIVARIATLGSLDEESPQDARLARVLIDEVGAHADEPLRVPAPKDPRALRLARLVEDAPAERQSVSELARRVGASRRTMERLFMAEVGVSVGEWRQRLRLHRALRLLAERKPIADVARASGYGSASAFIAAFRKQFGATPNRYRTRLLSL
jgi:AraC-like DNA-binding protein